MNNNEKAMKTTSYIKRHMCRVVLEAATPLAIGTGEKDFLTDATVALDVNGLPYIPATSIAGVIRHFLEQIGICVNDILGYQKAKEGMGSRIVFSDAKILDSKGNVRDGMFDVTEDNDSLLLEYLNLPIRQHVCITDKGTSKKGGKFDNMVVFAGTRFCFEMEFFLKDNEENHVFEELKKILHDETFRLGSGTRNGYGKVKVVSFKEKMLNLKDKKDLTSYIKKSSCLADEYFWDVEPVSFGEPYSCDVKYILSLEPRDFFLFGSGYGDTDSDTNAVTESKVVWNKEGTEAHVEENQTLIPATSIKGALSHRVAFYYNKKKGLYVGNSDAKTGNENKAVQTLFGFEDQSGRVQKRGMLIFSDIIAEPLKGKILNHVMIDRFTGGAVDGALFAERPLYGANAKFRFEVILVHSIDDDDIKYALEMSLKDICNGMLPLGGGINRGNGMFSGKVVKIEKGKETEL